MIRALVLVGTIVWYSGPYVGGPLRCGSVDGASPIYDETHTWIAIDIDRYEEWECADLVQVDAEGVQLLLRIKDSGPLSLYYVDTPDGLVPIVGDLPRHSFLWSGLSVRGTITNLTAGLRERMEVER